MPPIVVVISPYPIEQARQEALGALARARSELVKAARLLRAMGKELPADIAPRTGELATTVEQLGLIVGARPSRN